MKSYGGLLLNLTCAAAALGGILWGVERRPRSGEGSDQVRQLQAEVARLRAEIAGLRGEAEPPADAPANPVLPELDESQEALRLDLAYRAAELRGLPFIEAPAFETVPFEKLYRVRQDQVRAGFPGDAFERVSAALRAMGFMAPDTSLEQIFLDHSDLFASAAYDPEKRTVLLAEGTDLADSAARLFLAREVLRLLQDQHADRAALSMRPEVNWDQSLALLALAEGDIQLHVDDFHEGSRPPTETGPAPPSDVRQQITAAAASAPRLLQRLLLFPTEEGSAFARTLRESGSLQPAYAEPPVCTSQILHPELYLSAPRFRPREVRWLELRVGDAEPVFDTVLGEFLLREWLAQAADGPRAADLAAGWDGDRFTAYRDEAGVHCAWSILWTSPEEAAAFYQGVRDVVASLAGSAPQAQESPEDGFAALAEGAHWRVRRSAPDRIDLFRAASVAWMEPLQALADAGLIKRPD